jgi:hypothetical protein
LNHPLLCGCEFTFSLMQGTDIFYAIISGWLNLKLTKIV